MGGSVSTAAPGSQITPSNTNKSASAGDGVSSSDVQKIQQGSSQNEATKTQELPGRSLIGDAPVPEIALIPKFLSARVELVGKQERKIVHAQGKEALGQLNQGQIEVLKSQFDSIDKDGSGIITLAELTLALSNLGVYDTPEALDHGVKSMFSAMSKDGTARIHEEEFLGMMAMGMTNGMTDADIVAAFHAFDADSSGFVSRNELENAFKSLGGVVITPDEIHRMMGFFDTDGDGQIDIAEFTHVLKDLC